MLRLVIAYPHFTYPSGASAVALETAQRLAVRGHEVHVVSVRHDPAITSSYDLLHFHDLGGPLTGELRYWLSLGSVHARFSRIVQAIEPHVLIAHVFPANYWAFIQAKLTTGVRCSWYCHEPSAFVHDLAVIRSVSWPMRILALLANPLLQIFDRWAVSQCQYIITNSKYTSARVQRIYKRNSEVAYPGVDFESFDPETPKERMVIAVGRLTKFKRFDMVVQAAAALRGYGFSDLRWVIIGDGEDRIRLQQLAIDLGVTDLVQFAGRLSRSELIQYYNRSLIVAVTAIGEPFGIVPLEAMAAGTAVICSDNGGPAETVLHGLTGLHFRSGDVTDLVAKVLHLVSNLDVARSMGDAGRKRVLDYFSWEGTTDAIDEMLKDAVAG